MSRRTPFKPSPIIHSAWEHLGGSKRCVSPCLGQDSRGRIRSSGGTHWPLMGPATDPRYVSLVEGRGFNVTLALAIIAPTEAACRRSINGGRGAHEEDEDQDEDKAPEADAHP